MEIAMHSAKAATHDLLSAMAMIAPPDIEPRHLPPYILSSLTSYHATDPDGLVREIAPWLPHVNAAREKSVQWGRFYVASATDGLIKTAQKLRSAVDLYLAKAIDWIVGQAIGSGCGIGPWLEGQPKPTIEHVDRGTLSLRVRSVVFQVVREWSEPEYQSALVIRSEKLLAERMRENQQLRQLVEDTEIWGRVAQHLAAAMEFDWIRMGAEIDAEYARVEVKIQPGPVHTGPAPTRALPAHGPAPANPSIDQVVYAMGLLASGLSFSEIAKKLGVHGSTLYRGRRFKPLRDAAELAGTLKPRGQKMRKGNSPRGYKTADGRVEAYAEDSA
jgi:hypothetical protein